VVKAISAPTRIGPNEIRQVNSTQGQPTIITCGIDVDGPETKVIWHKNGKPINSPDIKTIIDGKRGRLQITDTTLQDEGLYECSVTNSVGNATEKTQIFVGGGGVYR
jgi:hypothetical protein